MGQHTYCSHSGGIAIASPHLSVHTVKASSGRNSLRDIHRMTLDLRDPRAQSSALSTRPKRDHTVGLERVGHLRIACQYLQGFLMAERVGFEPTVPCGTHAFQACALSHSAISPDT
jgi:hypothetical protein